MTHVDLALLLRPSASWPVMVACVLWASVIAAGPLTTYARGYLERVGQHSRAYMESVERRPPKSTERVEKRSGKRSGMNVRSRGAENGTSSNGARTPSRRRMALLTAGVIAATTIGARSIPTLALLLACGVLTPLLTAALIDFHVKRLPNHLLLAAVVAALCGAVTQSLLGSSALPLLRAVALGAALPAALLLFVRLKPGLGVGDIKLTAVFGLWLGPLEIWAPITALLLGLVSGALAALSLLVTGRNKRHDHLALGPPLLFGACLAFAIYAPSSAPTP